MTKILITPKNSVWGVIVNPQSSNTYRHALSFRTPQIKEDYINKELFSGGDYKAELAKQPEQSFTRFSATSAKFRIDPADYPNETFVSLLNKDFCIIEEDGVEQFYTLSAERSNTSGMIDYTAELDIFFTYDIKEMFNTQPTRIERAMLDRFWKTSEDENFKERIYPLISSASYNWDNPFGPIKYLDFNNPFYNNEPDIDNNISSEARIPTGEKDYFVPSVAHLVNGNAASAQVIDDILNASSWNTFFTTLSDDGKIPWADGGTIISISDRSDIKPQQISYKELKNEDPFSYHACVIAGVGKTKFFDKALNDYVTYEIKYRYNGVEYTVEPFPKDAISNGATLKNTYAPLPYHPFTNTKNITKEELEFSLVDGGTLLKILYIDFKDKYNDLPVEAKPFGLVLAKTTGITKLAPFLTLTNNSIDNIKTQELPFEAIPAKDYFDMIGSNKPWIPDLETKLLLSPYRKLIVKGASKNALELAPQFFRNTGPINFKQSHGYLPEAYSNWIEFTDYNTQYKEDVLDPSTDKSLFTEISNYSFPAETSAWNEYISQNRAQLNTSMGISGAGIGLGIIGALAAPFTGGASLAVTGASIGGLLSSTKAIANQAAQVKDIQNSPDKLSGTGSTLALDISLKSLKPTIREYSIDPRLKFLIAQHFFKYGYNLAEQLFDINLFLDTRQNFNYIKANETLENLKLQAAPEIKQLINDTLSNGLTIWHVRSAQDFDGIKNYKLQNLENSLGVG